MSITGSNNPFACEPVVFANANTIVSLGTITRDGNEFTFSIGFVWKINGVTYQNTAPVVITIAEASEGFTRIDNALLNTSNTIELQQGLESDTIALRPTFPDNNILLTSWNILGDAIEDTETPIVGAQFKQKNESRKFSTVLSGTDQVIEFRAAGHQHYEISGTVTSVAGFGKTLLLASPSAEIPYAGKDIFFENKTDHNITLKNNFSGVDIKFDLGTDLVVPTNGIVWLKYDATAENLALFFKSWSDLSGAQFKNKLESAGYADHILTGANAVIPLQPNGQSVYAFSNAGLTSIDGFGLDLITGNPSAEVPYPGKDILIYNNKAENLTLKHDGSGTADVKFLLEGSVDLVIPAGGKVWLKYGPSYCEFIFKSWTDNVIEGYYNGTNFYTDSGFTNLITPKSSRIYINIAVTPATQYRWSGSAYVQIRGIQGVFLGSVIPTDIPTGTGEAFWIATKNGTYTNFGGLVVNLNSFAFISRDSFGNFSISQTSIDLIAYAQKTQVLNESAISLGLDSVSIDNDFSANFTEFQNFNGGVISLDAGRLKVVASSNSKGVGIIPSYVENAKEHTVVFEIDLGTSASVLFYNKWANVIQTITASGTYEITFTSDNSGAFPYPIFASSNAGTFYFNYLKLKKANLNRDYSLKKETQKALDFTPVTISKTDFLTIPSYVSAYNGGVLSIESEKLKVVSTGQQGFRVTGLTSGVKYSLQLYIDIGATTGVKIFSANPTLVTTITKTGYYDITIPSVNFGVVEFLSLSAGTILVEYLNIYQNVKWATENQLRVLDEKTDVTNGNNDKRVQKGLGAVASDNESVAIGGGAIATQDKSTAIGVDAQATFSTIYDAGASENGENLAVGNQAKAFSWRAVAIGDKSVAGTTSTVALGFGAVANKVHGVAIGRGAYIPNITVLEAGVTVVGADLSNDFYISNGWGHRFKTPPSGIAISNITPSTTTKRYHGQDAYDELDGTQQNVQGGNVALSAGRGTGSAKGGKLLLETAPVSGTKTGNEKNDLVAGAAVTSETTTNTRLQLFDNATGTLKDVKYYVDGSGRKILYID